MIDYNDQIKIAAGMVRNGKVVAFPTETVYGLGADATNEEAVKQIYFLKGRPSINPLILHVADLKSALKLAEFNKTAIKLAEYFWPGPLTIVSKLSSNTNIARQALAELDTIAIRVPSHKLALELLREAAVPIAAPSANPSGYISATRHEHVAEHFAKSDILVLEDPEECRYGIESTIIDTTTEIPTILRYGFITKETIEIVLNEPVQVGSSLMQVKAPGMLEKHYSPKTKLRLNATSLKDGEVGLNFGNSQLIGKGCLNLSSKGDVIEAASNLYDMLKQLDDYSKTHNLDRIAVAEVLKTGVGLAINDRLQRAAAN
jgi:L-threonylcarbamoyladenylate synthase